MVHSSWESQGKYDLRGTKYEVRTTGELPELVNSGTIKHSNPSTCLHVHRTVADENGAVYDVFYNRV